MAYKYNESDQFWVEIVSNTTAILSSLLKSAATCAMNWGFFSLPAETIQGHIQWSTVQAKDLTA